VSLYDETGKVIRDILVLKLDEIIKYFDTKKDAMYHLSSLTQIVRGIASTRSEKEKKELYFLYLVLSAIVSIYYTIRRNLEVEIEELKENPEKVKELNDALKSLEKDCNTFCKAHLIKLKDALSKSGTKQTVINILEELSTDMIQQTLETYG